MAAPLAILIASALLSGVANAGSDPARRARFDYYVLVLGWSPSYCATEARRRGNDAQCDSGRHHFVLHGLWPQYAKGWPQDCWSGKRPWVSQKVIDEMRDIMPSKGLVIHEYRTHGTCAGLNPEQYYSVARQLYDRIETPAAFQSPGGTLNLSPEKIESEFLAANDWLDPDMISVTCRRGALLDVRVCFAPDLAPVACGVNEEKRVCRAGAVTVSPARLR